MQFQQIWFWDIEKTVAEMKTKQKKLALAFLLLVIAPPASAVYVKYHGEVDVDSGDFESFSLKYYSLVHEIHYDHNEEYLVVRLKNTYYHYCRIPAEVVGDWVGARSLGKFYVYNIKGNYDCRLGGIPGY